MKVKRETAIKMPDFLGLYLLSKSIKISQREKIISVRMRREKFLPVIKGKNKDSVTIKTKRGTSEMPPKIKYLMIFTLFSTLFL